MNDEAMIEKVRNEDEKMLWNSFNPKRWKEEVAMLKTSTKDKLLGMDLKSKSDDSSEASESVSISSDSQNDFNLRIRASLLKVNPIVEEEQSFVESKTNSVLQ